MSNKWKSLLYVSFILIIVPLIFFISSNESGKSIAERSLIDKSLLILMAVGILIFCFWFLGYLFTAVGDFVKNFFNLLPFLISLLTGKHKKEMLKAEENSKKQRELLAKLDELNNNPSMSDDEVAEKSLLLFKEYGIETNQSQQPTP